MKDLRRPQYRIIGKYPFMRHCLGAILSNLSDKDLEEVRLFPTIFQCITKQYMVITHDSNENIIEVLRLKDSQIFKVGDEVCYKLSDDTTYYTFLIGGFKMIENGNMIIQWNSDKYGCISDAVGINLIDLLLTKDKELTYKSLP